MRQLLIVSIILISIISLSAQSLSLNDLINLRSKSNYEIDKVLKTKGWKFDTKIVKSTYTKHTWNYANSKIGVFVFIETTDNNNTVMLKTSNISCYNELEKLIQSGSFKHIEKYTANGMTTNFYERNGYVVEAAKAYGVLTNNQILYVTGYMKKETYKMLKEFRK